jgi:hypothetical protein
MKNIFILLISASVISACGGNSSGDKQADWIV